MNRGILVLVEHLKGTITDITFEMLGIGKKIADELKINLYAAIFGREASPLTSNLGIADKVFVIEDPKLEMAPPSVTAAQLDRIIKQNEVLSILIGCTNVSSGIGPLLSVKAGFPFLNFCKNIKIQEGKLIVTSQLFGGKILSNIEIPDCKSILSIYPGSFPIEDGESDKNPTIEKLDVKIEDTKCEFKKYIEPDSGDVDITKQDILVSVGRGIETQDNLSLADDLVSLLGGSVCASRPVIDQGWLPLSRQVGKSGMVVKPKLYLALGISGAPEHIEGMKDSELIIAINKDPGAPIFNVAQYGVCSDINDVVPALIDEIKKRKGGK